MLFLAFKKVSPPNEKIPALNKIFHPCHPTGMGRFLPYPINAILENLSKTRCRDNFQIFHSLTVNCDSA